MKLPSWGQFVVSAYIFYTEVTPAQISTCSRSSDSLPCGVTACRVWSSLLTVMVESGCSVMDWAVCCALWPDTVFLKCVMVWIFVNVMTKQRISSILWVWALWGRNKGTRSLPTVLLVCDKSYCGSVKWATMYRRASRMHSVGEPVPVLNFCFFYCFPW